MLEHTETFTFGNQQVVLQTGAIARQASAAVTCSMGDTVVLVTVIANETTGEDDFLPLTVNYHERAYAAGRIPDSVSRREESPSEKEVLTSHLIDRAVRPLFPAGFSNVVQIVATVLSLDPEVNPDVPTLIGTSAALALSGVPFSGPFGAVRVGCREGEYLLNPTASELATSDLNMLVAGTEKAVVMVEAEARELSEKVMFGAILFGQKYMQMTVESINRMVAIAGKPKWEWQPFQTDPNLIATLAGVGELGLIAAYEIKDGPTRRERLEQVRTGILQVMGQDNTLTHWSRAQIAKAIVEMERRIVRGRILSGDTRIDGRRNDMVRPITIRTGGLPRVHGSTIYSQGETQAVVSVTLGMARDAQVIDTLDGEQREPFIFHCNFPPYYFDETGATGTPKRREVGHGHLAKRAIQAIIPSVEEFPYTIRVVSEITEFNGSSSMTSICGCSLALMDAGVPTRAPVAGVAMGLVKEGERYVVLTDVTVDEDRLADMDFKVAGTKSGVTVLQMDMKAEGLAGEIIAEALDHARRGRMHVLDELAGALGAPRANLSPYAPCYITFKIDPEKVHDLIGRNGETIRALCRETNTIIEVDSDGTVHVAAVRGDANREARRRVQLLAADIEVGGRYTGRVVKVVEFGAFVNILPGKTGLVHVSQFAVDPVKDVSNYLQEGDQVEVKVLDIDKNGQIQLSIKALLH